MAEQNPIMFEDEKPGSILWSWFVMLLLFFSTWYFIKLRDDRVIQEQNKTFSIRLAMMEIAHDPCTRTKIETIRWAIENKAAVDILTCAQLLQDGQKVGLPSWKVSYQGKVVLDFSLTTAIYHDKSLQKPRLALMIDENKKSEIVFLVPTFWHHVFSVDVKQEFETFCPTITKKFKHIIITKVKDKRCHEDIYIVEGSNFQEIEKSLKDKEIYPQ